MTNRVSSEQLEELLEFLAQHPNLAKGVGLGSRSKESINRQWNDLATKLNSYGSGSSKSGDRWKKYWVDIKHKTKSRLTKRRQDALGTGGGPSSQDDLSEIDQKILSIIGQQAVFGDTEHRVPVFLQTSQVEVIAPQPENNVAVEEADNVTESAPIYTSPSRRGQTGGLCISEAIVNDSYSEALDSEPTLQIPESSHARMNSPVSRPNKNRPRARRYTRLSTNSAPNVPVVWVRSSLTCDIPDAKRIPPWRSPPPLLEGGVREEIKPYLWRRNGQDFKWSTNDTLELSRSKDVEGVYQCARQIPRGYFVLGYPVYVKFAQDMDKVTVLPVNSTARSGQPHLLTCDVNSGPPAAISWLKNGQPLPKDGRYHFFGNQLLITDIKSTDAGLYGCRATNLLLNKSKSSRKGQLLVQEFAPDAPLEAGFLPIRYDTSIVAARESRVVLPCPVVGNPKPKLVWQLTPPGEKRTAELESVAEVLTMASIERDQAGLYVCRIEGNSSLVKTFDVTVTMPVTIVYPPESKHVVKAASTVRFNCTAIGEPAPNVTWYKDGQKFNLTGRYRIVLSAEKKLPQLLISSAIVKDSGVYQCFARHVGGVRSAWAVLDVAGTEAAAPRGLRCRPAGAADLELRWTPHPLEVVAYTVMSTLPGGRTITFPVQVPESPLKVPLPLTPYNIQIQAFIRNNTAPDIKFANVVSELSETISCQGQGVPIKLVKLGDDSILVSWRKFAKAYPGIVQWIVQYRVDHSSEEQNVTLDGSFYNYTLKGVSGAPGALQVRVLGSRSLPWPQEDLSAVPWTSAATADTYLGAGTVRIVPEDVELTELHATNFTVRWHCEDEVFPKPYNYQVCIRKVGGDENCLESFMTSAIVTNLEPKTDYQVRVQARLPGQASGGAFSAPLHVRTPAEGAARLHLEYQFVNESAARVSWAGGPRLCTVRYTHEYDLPHSQWTALDVYGTTVLLTELDPTKQLYVIVEGDPPVGSSPLLTVPAQISEVRNIEYQYGAARGCVVVSWAGEGRTVKYSQNLSQPIDSWAALDGSRASVQICGLDGSLTTYVLVSGGGDAARVLMVPPRPLHPAPPDSGPTMIASIVCGILLAILAIVAIAVGAVCYWKKRKRSRSSGRSRQRRSSHNIGSGEEGSDLKRYLQSVGGRLANGGERGPGGRGPGGRGPGGRGPGEPLLNGHVRITENPTQAKTPNGRLRGRLYEDTAFDTSRPNDVTLETTVEPDSFDLIDTSRTLDPDLLNSTHSISVNESFNKLPDGNMNSELRVSDFQLNSKILPTLQPNG